MAAQQFDEKKNVFCRYTSFDNIFTDTLKT
jgi:hypothetical protein